MDPDALLGVFCESFMTFLSLDFILDALDIFSTQSYPGRLIGVVDGEARSGEEEEEEEEGERASRR
jgi:hypothetical protein